VWGTQTGLEQPVPLDKNSESTENADNNGAASRPRRRATRKVAAPQAVDKLDILAELGADQHGGSQDETGSARERTEAQLNAALDLASAERGDTVKKPARKRATRTAEPVAVDVPPAVDTAPPARAPRSRAPKKAAAEPAGTSAAEVPAAEETSAAPTGSTASTGTVAAKTARKTPVRKTAARKSSAGTDAAAATSAETPTTEAPTTGETSSVPSTTTKSRGRRSTAATATAGSAAPETTPEAVTGTEEAPTTAPKARRSRRAAGATTPEAAPAAAESPVDLPEAAPVADDAAPAKRPSRRASTRKTAAAPAASDEAAPGRDAETSSSSTSADAAADGAGGQETAVREAPARRTSRRATSTAGALKAKAEPAPTDAAPTDVRTTDAAPTDAEQPAPQATKPATRSRRATRPVTSAVAEDAAAPATTPSAEPATSDLQAPQRPRLAATAVLFQAPDLGAARPKRRRASAPAGSPDEVRAGVHAQEAAATDAEAVLTPEELLAEEEALAAAALAEAQAEPESTDEGEQADEDDDQAPRRRRRRGGRGRRHRGGNGSDENDTDDVDRSATGDEDDAAPGSEPADAEDTGAEQAGDEDSDGTPARQRGGRSRGGRGRGSRSGRSATDEQDDEQEPVRADATSDSDDSAAEDATDDTDEQDDDGTGSSRRRRRRRGGRGSEGRSEARGEAREPEARQRSSRNDEVTALKGSTRLEAKRQRRRDGRDAGRRRQVITESEFLARRESVERSMIVRERDGRTQIAVLEDNVLVEHYVSQQEQASMAGNVYLGRVQNVLPSMEAAFIDVGKGRNAVLYAGEVNWDASGLAAGQPRRIELALKSGDSVLVQVTKDPIGQKGARLTSQITLAGRYLVYVPGGGMTGISRKLPETERARLKRILREAVPEAAGVIVRTAAEGASEDELKADIARLQGQWAAIEKKAKSASAPALLQGEPDLSIRVVRDIFNDDFTSLAVSGESAWTEISDYVGALAPDLASKVTRWTSERDIFAEHRIDEQLAKGLDRKVYLPSGGSLVIDRTEAMTVVDVNTGKFTGAGGTLEETVTRNNLEAAEEIVRQLRLRDIGGIVVIDFIDMVLESNRDLVLRRLVECLGRDRTKHQVAEVTSLGLVQMTRKRVGQGLVEAFSETCEHCHGRGFIVHDEPIERGGQPGHQHSGASTSSKSSTRSSGKSSKSSGRSTGEAAADDTAATDTTAAEAAPKRSRRRKSTAPAAEPVVVPVLPEERSEAREAVKATLAQIAAAAQHAHDSGHEVAHEEKA